MNDMREKARQWLYYLIIGLISFVALVFLPMIGSTVGLAWVIPNTVVGWIVWCTVKIIISTINVLIFYSFMQQAKINVKSHPQYVEGCQILNRIKEKNYIPRSPRKWQSLQYGRKGTIIFLISALSLVALTQAILTFDWTAMLTYLFTIIMGIVFGILQMKKAEEYWTDEFWKYAKMVEEQNIEEQKRLEELSKQVEIKMEENNKQTEIKVEENKEVPINEELIHISNNCGFDSSDTSSLNPNIGTDDITILPSNDSSSSELVYSPPPTDAANTDNISSTIETNDLQNIQETV